MSVADVRRRVGDAMMILCWADILGRNAISGLELPVGVMAALAGSPFFLWMLISRKQVRR